MFRISQLLNTDLSKQAEFTLKELLSDAFEGDFSEEDWQHTFGGMRFLGHHKDQLIAHGAVVKRWMQVDGLKTLVGYVEGIAIAPAFWRKGFGSLLMAELTSYCRKEFQLSMLSTDEKSFYRKQGWLDFEGKSYVLKNGLERQSQDEDKGLMYLVGANKVMDAPMKVVCESREGDSW